METSIGGMLILGVAMVAFMVMTHAMLVSNQLMVSSIKEGAEFAAERAQTQINQTYSASTGSRLRVDLKNTGGTSVSDYADMEFIVDYQAVGGALVSKRLTYVSSTPGNNQWSDRFRTPDAFQPGIWDSDEELKLLAVLEPKHDTSTRGTVTVATPNGVSVTGSFLGPYWESLSDTPSATNDGASLATDATHIYALRGSNNSDFWRYDVVANTWSSLSNTPVAVDDGSALLYASGYVYALGANDTNAFWRYSVSAGSWETLAVTPVIVEWGGALTWDGSDIVYAFRGNDQVTFWGYSSSTNTWDTTLADAPATVQWGGSLAYVAGDIYGFRGNLSTAFWRYSVSGDSWSVTPPADAPGTVERGGTLTWPGGDYIYATRGNNSNDFWRYSISNDSWESQVLTPSQVDPGGALIYLDGDIYALRGSNTPAFWKFRPTDF